MPSQARSDVTIDVEECKECGLCADSCPPKCLVLAPELSKYGVHPATYTGEGAPAAAYVSIAALSREPSWCTSWSRHPRRRVQ